MKLHERVYAEINLDHIAYIWNRCTSEYSF